MPSKKLVSLKISNCLDCPHHKQVPSALVGDSFDMVDVDTICLKVEKGTYKGRFGVLTKPARVISSSDRPWQARENCDVPEWCPLMP